MKDLCPSRCKVYYRSVCYVNGVPSLRMLVMDTLLFPIERMSLSLWHGNFLTFFCTGADACESRKTSPRGSSCFRRAIFWTFWAHIQKLLDASTHKFADPLPSTYLLSSDEQASRCGGLPPTHFPTEALFAFLSFFFFTISEIYRWIERVLFIKEISYVKQFGERKWQPL